MEWLGRLRKKSANPQLTTAQKKAIDKMRAHAQQWIKRFEPVANAEAEATNQRHSVIGGLMPGPAELTLDWLKPIAEGADLAAIGRGVSLLESSVAVDKLGNPVGSGNVLDTNELRFFNANKEAIEAVMQNYEKPEMNYAFEPQSVTTLR